MSLQVWLPFTKDLRQQGLANTPSLSLVSGNSLVNDGKVGGQCLALTKLQTILGNSSCMSNKKQISYAYWVKVNTAWSRNWLDGIRWTSSNGSTTSVARQEFYTNCTKIGTWFPSSSTSSISGKDFTPGVWTHLAATLDYNTGDVSFYINGVLQGHVTTLDTTYYCRGDFYIGDNGVDISMNDVRIYDHCLSPMEVKELAKGLVLHYPLNRQGWGQENLAKNTNGVIIDGLGSTPGSRHEYYAFNCGTPFSVNAGDTVTVSFDLYETINTAGSGYLYVYNTNNKGPHQIAGVNVLAGRTIAVGDIIDERISFTTTVSNRSDATQTNDFIEFYSNYGTSNWFKISNLKVEKGSIPTPWCPNSSDALATTMGLNSTTEYDCSGFCNNGIRNKTFTWTSDTPKYAVSQNFNNNHLIEAEGLPTETSTIACWIKWHTLPSGYTIPIHDKQSGLAIGLTNKTRLISYVGTGNGGSGSCVNVSLETNIWYHIVVVKTGTNTRKVYINGEEITSMAANNYWGGDLNKFLVGGRHISGSYSNYIDGQICDVRAYATALSASDVKSLYQNCATIDPDGTIRGQIRS